MNFDNITAAAPPKRSAPNRARNYMPLIQAVVNQAVAAGAEITEEGMVKEPDYDKAWVSLPGNSSSSNIATSICRGEVVADGQRVPAFMYYATTATLPVEKEDGTSEDVPHLFVRIASPEDKAKMEASKLRADERAASKAASAATAAPAPVE